MSGSPKAGRVIPRLGKSVLNQACVLIAEDEPFIALDLALAIEDAGGRVLGPAASVKEALALLETTDVAGAILDVTLADEDVTSIAERLIERGVPLIVQTGVGLPAAMTARFPHLPVRIKPCDSARLVDDLVALIGERPKAV